MKTGFLFKSIWDKIKERPKAVSFYKQHKSFDWIPISNEQYIFDIKTAIFFLKKHNIKKGDTICLLIPTSYEWDVLEKSSFFLGLNLIAFDPRQNKTNILNNFLLKSSIVVAQEKFNLPLNCEQPPLIVNVLDIPILGQSKNDNAELIFEIDPTFDDLTAYTLFTSGSTGNSKALIYNQKQIHETLTVLINFLKEEAQDEFENCKTLAWLPLANPFQRIFNLMMFFKNSTIYFEKNPAVIMKTLRMVKPNHIITIPYFMEKLKTNVQYIFNEKFPLKFFPNCVFKDFIEKLLINYLTGNNIKYFISGSAALQAETLLYFKARKINILQAYGLSETLLPVAMNTPYNQKDGSVGKPFKIQPIKMSENGEIFLKSSFASNSLNLTKEDWLKTNDFGFLDGDGYLFLKGRGSDFIKLATGNKVTRSLIENQIKQIPGVDQCALVGNEMNFLSVIITITPDNKKELNNRDYWNLKISCINSKMLHFQQIRCAIINFRLFSIEKGEMTNNSKLRYSEIESFFKPSILNFINSKNDYVYNHSKNKSHEQIIIRLIS
jgi:long-chain acyl-CoA synthetase